MDRGLNDYATALDALFARTGATSKYGLERTVDFLALLGNPHQKIRTLHVAGTNGKGSVVAVLYALLRAKGFRVGRYTSPHLIDFRERIVVDDDAISEEYVLGFLGRWNAAAARIGATFFEITTCLAFDYFASREVDIAVIETGLGGRLDSTNVIRPLVAGVTSIGIDHQQYLGATEELIAAEKAGIFKPGVPSVIGAMSTTARVAIYRAAAEAGVAAVVDATRLYRTKDVAITPKGTSFTIEQAENTQRVTTGLTGSAQASNTAVALSMLRAAGGEWCATLEEAAEILPSVKLAGRFQRVDNVILDVAHNPDGMRSLAETLAAVRPPRPLVALLGVLNDKDWRQMMVTLSRVVDRFVLARPQSAPPDRAWDPADALAFARTNSLPAEVDPDFEHAVRAVSSGSGTALVTGSFHTVGDALRILGKSAL